jgi:hypothetical protein
MRERRLRARIAEEAARLLYSHEETEYLRAKRKAARILGFRFKPDDLPSNREVRGRLEEIAATFGARPVVPKPREVLLEALRWLRRLSAFHPRLVWPPPEPGSADVDFELRVFVTDIQEVLASLKRERFDYAVQPARSVPGKLEAMCIPVHIVGRHPARFFICPLEQQADPPLSLTTGEPIRLVDEHGLEAELAQQGAGADLESELLGIEGQEDRFDALQLLLTQLEDVRSRDQTAGDALHHALQVFDLAVLERPYDEEFLTAALLHDVGSLSDPNDPTADSAEILEGLATHRTLWLIAHLADDPPARPRDASDDDWDDLQLLRDLEAAGGLPGVETRTLRQAIDYLRLLAGGALWVEE